MESAVTVGLILPELARSVAEEHLEELQKLIETAGGTVVARVFGKRNAPDPATYVGSGKAEEIKRAAEELKAGLVVFDDDLSPAQVRNLEKIIPAKVIDRSALILDIFAGRARSRESRTQVELAQLEYLLPRLTRQWSHLSRQAGGIGTRGVGETQLEIDRRIIRHRISRLKEDLVRIERTRETQRKGRQTAFTVALVGYTNAGKSTLFNRLTKGGAAAADQLFATLDAKLQRAAFEMPRETVIIDTVGFIRKLPHHLVASFRSTMEEAVSADLVLHIVDLSHPQSEDQRDVGDEVLRALGIPPERVIEVYNKCDAAGDHTSLAPVRRNAVTISALTGHNLEALIEMIRRRELDGGELMQLAIPHRESRVLARLHEIAQVYEQSAGDESVVLSAWIPKDSRHLFEAYAVTTARAS
ncbi:MAG TPA: GTPase HflX [Thermoanaerobaculia bacterium]|nr:GTPase HflX [Thermoanaerobaculia bacterium]